MFYHAKNKSSIKKYMFCLFMLLTIHAYFYTVLLVLSELDNLTNKTKVKPFYGNGYRRKYETNFVKS